MPISNINSFNCIGRLTKESELRYSQNGKSICKFSVAVNRSEKDDNGYTNFPTYFNVVTFGKLAEACSSYLHKGSLIGITGEIRGNKWEDNQGNKRYNYDLIANNVQFLDPKEKQGNYHAQPSSKPKELFVEEEVNIDEIPF